MRAVFIRRFLRGVPEISVADIYCQRKLECLLRKYYGADAVPPLGAKAPPPELCESEFSELQRRIGGYFHAARKFGKRR